MKSKYDNGLSEDVMNSEQYRNYIRGGAIFGYIGSSSRTAVRDRIVEQALRKTGLGDNGIACWLTSTDARHMMDNVDNSTSTSEFIKIVNDYTKDAFVNVAVWSHPDHDGTLTGTIELKTKLAKQLIENLQSH